MASSGNFFTMNLLVKGTENVSSGSCKLDLSTNNRGALGNFEIPLTGKWYFECFAQMGSALEGYVGIADIETDLQSSRGGITDSSFEGFGFSQYTGSNYFSIKVDSGTADNSGRIDEGTTNNAVLGIAVNRDDNEIKLYTNNSLKFTLSISATTQYFPIFGVGGSNNSSYFMYLNAGQDSSFGGNKTAGGNSDGNGFGDFFYSPPSNHLALCSANLPIDSDIDPAQTDDDHPVKLCNAVTYTGTGSARTVSGFGFQPDMVWIKNRASPGDQAHRIVDSSRGVSKAMIPEDTQQENTETTAIQAFNSDGFTIGSATGGYNTSSGTYIAWGWKANGGTTSTNTSGTVTTTVQSSTAGGFSILTYTGGNGSWGSTNQDTIGHGLSAAPEFMLFKERNATDMWTVFHHSVGAGGGTTAAHNNLRLDNNEALYTNQSYKAFGGVMPTSTVITVEGNTTNLSTSNHIAYIWHGVEGYSKFGAYEGNNNDDGTFVHTGFRPRIIFIKSIDQQGEWVVYDTARNVDNPVDSVINWDASSAESANDATRAIDALSNGFKIRTSNITINNTNTFVYGAWGDVSFKYNNTHAQ
mgnify:CR=1 FL=1